MREPPSLSDAPVGATLSEAPGCPHVPRMEDEARRTQLASWRVLRMDDNRNELEACIVAALQELRGRETIPRWMVGTFTWVIPAIEAIARRDDLVVVNAGGEDPDQVIRRAVERLGRYRVALAEDSLELPTP